MSLLPKTHRLVSGLVLCLLGSFLLACSTGGSSKEDDGGGGAPSSSKSAWEIVELADSVCADGSQYKFFVKRAEGAEDLAITLEPGGGCWSFETCRGARVANVDGLRDDHMSAFPPPIGQVEGAIPWGLMFPHLGESDAAIATADFNQVYFPYCTGDAFLGDLVAQYESVEGDESIEVHHRGARNLRNAEAWLKENFRGIRHLLVTGASAGALGATINYALLRDAIAPERASLLSDSGPLFPPSGPQSAARQAFTERWDTEALLSALDERLAAPEEERLIDDSGNINSLLARVFPEDRFIATHFMRDLNYSLFSYTGFFDDLSTERAFELWEEDTDLLVETMEGFDNWGYYFPGFRADGCSHTVSLLPVDELSNFSFIADARAGEADGYLRTDLGDSDFGDALLSALATEGDVIRRREQQPVSTFTDEQLASCWLGFE